MQNWNNFVFGMVREREVMEYVEEKYARFSMMGCSHKFVLRRVLDSRQLLSVLRIVDK